MLGVPPTAFATNDPLTDDELHAAGPPRYPRPSRLADAARGQAAEGGRRRRAARPPHGRRPARAPAARPPGARTIIELSPGETATVVVEVRSIASRPVRRRGMRPLVEAVVADETGTMKATFFNQPWLERKYRPGTRLLLQGKYEARNRFRVQFHARDRRGGRRGRLRRRDLPRHRGPVVDPDPRARARVARRRAGGARAAAGAPARARRAAGPRRRRSTPRTSATTRAAAGGWPTTSCCCSRSRCCERRARRREGSRATPLEPPGELTARWLDGLAAVRADRRPAQGDGRRRRRARARPADAAPADGRGRLRQDRGGACTRCCARSSPAPRPR